MLAELERTGEDQISLTDPDSRAMAAHTHVAVGYNVQIAVDTKHKLIVEQQVTNQVVDMGLLTETADTGEGDPRGRDDRHSSPTEATSRSRTSRPAKRPGSIPYVPRPQRGPSVREGLFRKDEFNYDPDSDSYDLSGRAGPATLFVIASARAEEDQLRQQRGLPRLPLAFAMHRQQLPLGIAARERGRAGPDGRPAWRSVRILDQRREIVEHPFGSIKQWMYQGAFLMRGLGKVRAEFSLTALAYNLRRVLNLVAFDGLMAAVTATTG